MKRKNTDYIVIDPHTHCRDEEWADKATIASTLNLALSQGVDIVFDMPNLPRPVINRGRVQDRLDLVPKGMISHYRTYVGLTADANQIHEALWCYHHFDEVIGLKLFAGPSVGDLAVESEDEQLFVYQELAKCHYQGVLAVHCEKEGCFQPELWDRRRLITYGYYRPKKAEIESVRDQIRFAEESGFAGTLYICHISCRESVDLIQEAKKRGKIKIVCEATPRHLMYNTYCLCHSDGFQQISNPPLRSPIDMQNLRNCLVWEYIDCIGTDHAPHTDLQKRKELLPGYPTLRIYRLFIDEFLPDMGIKPKQIRQITSDNIINIFNDKLKA